MRERPDQCLSNVNLPNTPSRDARVRQLWIHSWSTWFLLALCLSVPAGGSLLGEPGHTGVLLPDGSEFVSWEQPFQPSKTYYVDNRNALAADSNPGTKELPFATIDKAAQVLQPGERVVIMTGIYRERVAPRRGGT